MLNSIKKLRISLLVEKAFCWLMLLLAIAPSLPTFRFLLASSMSFHMLVQMPLIIMAGYLLSRKILYKTANQPLYFYLGCWLWILLSSMFWMLPISLDKALLNPYWDIFKILTLLIAGFSLKPALAGSKILSLFFIGSIIMMLFFIGYFYQDSELRLCNSYLIESQKSTGVGLIIAAFLILIVAIIKGSKHLEQD